MGEIKTVKTDRSALLQTIISGIAITLLALAIRMPYLDLVPYLSAGNENNLSLEILYGGRPLTNQNPHLGALSPYIVAGALAIFGFHSWVPRLVPLIFGLMTVLLTWRLGTRTSGFRTGIMAAVMMSAAWYHVVFSSHFPWSNSLTPFFATAFLLVLSRYMTNPGQDPPRRHPALALLGGLLFGLGMQTHPEMVTLTPVIIMVLILRERSLFAWLKRPLPWLLALGGALGYANMLYYNLVNRFQSVEFGLTYPEYALTQEYTATSVSGNYLQEFLYLPRIILGLIDDGTPWSRFATHPLIWLFWGLLLGGLILSVRQRRYLIPTAFLSSFLIIPAINSNYSLYLGRYLVFMFPPALILVAESLHGLLSLELKPLVRGPIRLGTLSLLVVLTLFPLVQVFAYYHTCDYNGLTRERYHRLDEIVAVSGYQNPLIVLDQETGEANEFLQFLREEGYACQFHKFRDHRGDPVDLTDILADIQSGSQSPEIDGIVYILAPWNRYRLLQHLPVDRFLGQIDARFESGLVDFYRAYGAGFPATVQSPNP